MEELLFPVPLQAKGTDCRAPRGRFEAVSLSSQGILGPVQKLNTREPQTAYKLHIPRSELFMKFFDLSRMLSRCRYARFGYLSIQLVCHRSISAMMIADHGTIVSALAFENIEAAGIMNKQVALEFAALKGSLGLMSKVLSDILDL